MFWFAFSDGKPSGGDYTNTPPWVKFVSGYILFLPYNDIPRLPRGGPVTPPILMYFFTRRGSLRLFLWQFPDHMVSFVIPTNTPFSIPISLLKLIINFKWLKWLSKIVNVVNAPRRCEQQFCSNKTVKFGTCLTQFLYVEQETESKNIFRSEKFSVIIEFVNIFGDTYLPIRIFLLLSIRKMSLTRFRDSQLIYSVCATIKQ